MMSIVFMNNISLFLNIEPPKKVLNERQDLLKQIQCAINVERVGTKYKPKTGRAIAMKVSHIPTKDLYYLISICKDSKNRRGSFSKCLFGCLKLDKKNG